MTGIDTETWHELAENRTGWRQAVKNGVRSFEAERLKARADKRQKRKANRQWHWTQKSNKILLVLTLYVRRVVEPANREWASTATPEAIHNNTDIIKIDEFTTTLSNVSICSLLSQPWTFLFLKKLMNI